LLTMQGSWDLPSPEDAAGDPTAVEELHRV